MTQNYNTNLLEILYLDDKYIFYEEFLPRKHDINKVIIWIKPATPKMRIQKFVIASPGALTSCFIQWVLKIINLALIYPRTIQFKLHSCWTDKIVIVLDNRWLVAIITLKVCQIPGILLLILADGRPFKWAKVYKHQKAFETNSGPVARDQ